MGDITTIGLDIAKNVFQVHAVDEACSVVVRRYQHFIVEQATRRWQTWP
jgi:hypothetical protein